MAGKVFFSVSMSLDGFIAPESLEDLMGQQWVELRSVAVERVGDLIGNVPFHLMAQLDDALRLHLDL